MKIEYVPHDFKEASLATIEQANEIIQDYQAQGYNMTLRQLYYQFVARDLMANNMKSYNRLKSIVSTARLAGMIDWEALEDRTRRLQGTIYREGPVAAIHDMCETYVIDKWADQPVHIEVWVEKEALIGVFAQVCDELGLDYFACRGYVSQSAMWRAAARARYYQRRNKPFIVLHFGDHDPSGIDMTRDIEERFAMFEQVVEVKRLALNMDQVDHYRPPPNPAKITDSRAQAYIAEHGASSWELDALTPKILSEMVMDAVMDYRDPDIWEVSCKKEEADLKTLQGIASNWSQIKNLLEKGI